MATKNPGKGRLKPHLVKTRTGIWRVMFRDEAGDVWSRLEVAFMTENSRLAKEALIWADRRNARIIANQRSYKP